MHDDPNHAGAPGGDAGGEWQVLRDRLAAAAGDLDAERLWAQLRLPLRGAALLLAAVIVLKLYGAILATIASVPTLSGLLELVGLIALARFSAGHLLRRVDRDQTLAALAERWRGLLGKG